MDPEKAKKHVQPPSSFEYTTRDAIIYALGVGAHAKQDVRYLYENHEEFVPLPTFMVAPCIQSSSLMGWPGVEFDLVRVLHGEQYIEVHEPLPAEAKLRVHPQVVDILDKGTGALILSNVTIFDDNTGKKLCTQQMGVFQVGAGGFNGPRSSPHEKAAADIPDRKPDAVVEEKTSVDQAALYRMGGGDLNPLHIDPNFATMSGFKEPILHGLCSLGFATRHVINTWAGNDVTLFKALKVRFTTPVIPGQTLQTEMWRDGNRIIFQTKVKETGKVAVAKSWVELKKASEKPTIQAHLSAKL